MHTKNKNMNSIKISLNTLTILALLFVCRVGAQTATIEPGSIGTRQFGKQATVRNLITGKSETTEMKFKMMGVYGGGGEMGMSKIMILTISYNTTIDGKPAQIQYTVYVPSGLPPMNFSETDGLQITKDTKAVGQIVHGTEADGVVTQFSGIVASKSGFLWDGWLIATKSPLPKTSESRIKEIIPKSSEPGQAESSQSWLFKIDKNYSLTRE